MLGIVTLPAFGVSAFEAVDEVSIATLIGAADSGLDGTGGVSAM